MTKSQSDIDELKTLQREAARVRAERKRCRSKATSDAEQQSATAKQPEGSELPTEEAIGEEQTPSHQKTAEPHAKRKRPRATAGKELGTAEDRGAAAPATRDWADEEKMTESEKAIHDLAGQIESVVKEMEEAARERPVLALMSAFTIGIVIGQLFSRR